MEALGENESQLLFDGETVSPRQFFGLDLNPRAVPIANLVLWIGFLKWQLRTVELASIYPEPILNAYGTIPHQDPLLAYDRQELRATSNGTPITVWDGVTTKLHPITGEEIPTKARAGRLRYLNAAGPLGPMAGYIVGNPPFVGGKDMRAELVDGYAEARLEGRPEVPGGADFVMLSGTRRHRG